MTRFTVAAPNWNEMPWMESMFLAGLRSQTFRDFDVVMVDAGSTDGSREAFNRFGDVSAVWILNTTRNIGYIRNVAALFGRGEILVHTSSDIEFPPSLLQEVNRRFSEDPKLFALAGRAIPVGEGAGLICRAGYWGFDVIRTILGFFGKMRPAGNFLCIKRSAFMEMGGYPEVEINEDGLLGYRIDDYRAENNLHAAYDYGLNVKHHVKRFEKGVAGIKGIIFYIYMLQYVFPFLGPWLKPLEKRRRREFSTRSDLKR